MSTHAATTTHGARVYPGRFALLILLPPLLLLTGARCGAVANA
ncbi:MAG: hypothetical protein WAN26_06530 [Steroidobacteraceae bacterium]